MAYRQDNYYRGMGGLMTVGFEYKIIASGLLEEINRMLDEEVSKGWEPISHTADNGFTIMLKRSTAPRGRNRIGNE